MLRRIRIVLAALCFAAVTLLFFDFMGTLHAWLGWTARIQFLPAVLALNVGVVAALVVLTLLFGRVYCSVVCPLGVMQDIVAWCGGRGKKRKFRYGWSPAKNWLRYGVLAIFIVALVAGVGSVVALLAPYSSYGRIAANLFALLWRWGNNLLAWFAERADSYAFYSTEVWLRSLPTFIIAAVTFVVLAVLAWRNGRTYCNTICPVGTVLGFFARYSLFRPVIDTAKCNGCTLCSRRCKAACIDAANHTIDYSRCVACMDCIDTCAHGAISYQRRKKADMLEPVPVADGGVADPSRRHFLTGAALLAGAAAAKAQEKKVDGGLAVILDKKVPHRATPIVPPGSALHRMPVMRVGLPERRAAPVDPIGNADATRKFLRTGLLSTGMHEMFGGVSGRCDSADYARGEVGCPDRPCRVGTRELCPADRRRRVRQLCAALSGGSYSDGFVRRDESRCAEDSRGERGALHRLRRLRKSLSGTTVQCDLCRGTPTA